MVSAPITSLSPQSSLRVSELFESVQGEGASLGRRAVFLRLAVCNLRCAWCDTEYSWNFQKYRFEDEVSMRPVAWVAAQILERKPALLIVTGGEPLLQQEALLELFTNFGSDLDVEIETNGTLAPIAGFGERVDQFNVSPKLGNSGESLSRRFKPDVLAVFSNHANSWLKLVIQDPEELSEVDELVSAIDWPRSRVLLMAEGTTRETLEERSEWLRPACRERGFGFSPRLHVLLWGNRRGV